jgi:hypothetical protein
MRSVGWIANEPGDCSSLVREIIVVTLATKRSFPTKGVTVYHISQYTRGMERIRAKQDTMLRNVGFSHK